MILTPMGSGTAASALYPDFVGRRAIFVGSGKGPANASATVGDPVSLQLPNYYVDAVLHGAATDGTYFCVGVPNGTGPRATWSLFYYAVSAPTSPYAGTALATKTFVISAFVGQY